MSCYQNEGRFAMSEAEGKESPLEELSENDDADIILSPE